MSSARVLVSGMAVGKELATDYSKLSDAEIEKLSAMLYNQRARPVPQ